MALPGILAALVVTWYFLWDHPGKALSHTDLMLPDTAIRVVVAPPRVQKYLSSLAPAATKYIKGIPRLSSMQSPGIRFDWIHKMPLEMAFLLDQRDPGYLGVTLFMREHPKGEPLDRQLADSSFLHDLYPMVWNAAQMSVLGRGRYTIEGRLTIPQAYHEAAVQHWPAYQPVEPPSLSGNHFIEVGINNVSGVLVELMGGLLAQVTPWADDTVQGQLLAACEAISEASLVVDLEDNDLLGFYLTLSAADEGSAQVCAQTAESAGQALAGWLDTVHRLKLDTEVTQKGRTVSAVSHLSGFEAPLRRSFGG